MGDLFFLSRANRGFPDRRRRDVREACETRRLSQSAKKRSLCRARLRIQDPLFIAGANRLPSRIRFQTTNYTTASIVPTPAFVTTRDCDRDPFLFSPRKS